MIKQYPQLEKSATAAKSAADTARDALDIQTRPWVNLVISGIKISGKEGAEAQLRYSVDAALMNSGIHPALKAGFAFVQDPVEGQEGLLYNETKCSAARNEVEEHNAKSVTPVANIIFPGESGKQVLSAYPVGFKSIFSAGTRVHIIGCVWYYGRDPKDMHRTVVRYVGTPKSFEVGTTLSDFTLEYANAQ
ncbi:MAG: hypothetical protein HY010_21195 [Acidobacteria bacterium]|nr:hypothetical protein [Acidobacteriota bacterium]